MMKKTNDLILQKLVFINIKSNYSNGLFYDKILVYFFKLNQQCVYF